MTAKELTDVLGAIADHFASNDANVREKAFGHKLKELLGLEEPAEPAEATPESDLPVTEA